VQTATCFARSKAWMAGTRPATNENEDQGLRKNGNQELKCVGRPPRQASRKALHYLCLFDLLRDPPPQPPHEVLHHLLVRGQRVGSGGGAASSALCSTSFIVSICRPSA
jgi:hypothetical protein